MTSGPPKVGRVPVVVVLPIPMMEDAPLGGRGLHHFVRVTKEPLVAGGVGFLVLPVLPVPMLDALLQGYGLQQIV